MLVRHALIAMCAFALTGLAACGDDPPGPGALNANWKFAGTSDCEDLHIKNLEARVVTGSGTIVAQNSATCDAAARSGAILVESIAVGTYLVEVEGYDDGGVGRYLGVSASSIGIPEGGTAETDPITLLRKGATLTVDWGLPGGKCSSSDVATVRIELLDDTGQPLDDGSYVQEVDCDHEFADPDSEDPANPEMLPGVVFEDLDEIEDMIVLGTGVNDAGEDIARAQVDGVDLAAGDRVDISASQLNLEACPSIPCQ